MYFDEPVAPFDRPAAFELRAVVAIAAIIIMFFFVYPGFVVDGADAVSAALFAG
jgi:NADH-quinone oxidoreductase subunit N